MQITLISSCVDRFDGVKEGLESKGVEVFSSHTPMTEKVACWGWRKGEEYLKKGHDVLVFERSYLGDRHHCTSIAWNGLNGHGDFKLGKVSDPKINVHLTPWHDGSYIVIMGQVSGDASLKGQNMTRQYEEWAKEAKRIYNMPVFFRPHPNTQRGNFKPDIPHIEGSLQDVLDDCHLVMCYNSNSSVDAVINGVPCITFDRGSMAYEVTGHEVRDRITPSRKEWLYKLTHCQWTPQEIANGDYVERMFCK